MSQVMHFIAALRVGRYAYFLFHKIIFLSIYETIFFSLTYATWEFQNKLKLQILRLALKNTPIRTDI